MKLLVMCEGPNELAVINMLLDADRLTFTRDDLLGLVPYHARQLSAPQVRLALNQYPGKVEVLRVGDKLNDQLKISKDDCERIDSIEKYCTKPELEMLLIIAEGLAKDFEKVKAGKNRIKPKDFCKQNISFKGVRYDNRTQFYYDYFGSDIDKLCSAIMEYRSTHGAHKKDEGYLATLLK